MSLLLTSLVSAGGSGYFDEGTSTDYIGLSIGVFDHDQPYGYSDPECGLPTDWIASWPQWQELYFQGATITLNGTIPRYMPDYTALNDIGHCSGRSSPSSDVATYEISPSFAVGSLVAQDANAHYMLNRTQSLPACLSTWHAQAVPALQAESRASLSPKARSGPHDPPTLFYDHQVEAPPPPSLSLCSSDTLYPHPQSPRSPSDLYTPSYTRGTGSIRAGWCSPCQSWHTLRDSAYWYHMHFVHGISCATRQRLPSPVDHRDLRGDGDWEGKCGGCDRWVAIAKGEKGRTAWFRHAYKCQLKGLGSRIGRGRSDSGSTGSMGQSRSPRQRVAKVAS
nr:hypothetical protein B0A51_13081 [Rachicladosporium sp. CCFEE 5018]